MPAVALDHVRRRHHLVVLGRDQAVVGVDLDAARARGRRRAHVQHLALAVEVHARTWRDRLQPDGLQRTVRLAEIVPDARVLGAHPPERIAPRAIVVAELDLVEDGGGVEEPDDVVGPIVVDVAVGRIQRVVVEAGGRLGIAGGLGRVVEDLGLAFDGLAVLAQLPVVAVVAERDDHPGRVELRGVLVEVLLVPVLAGRRSRLAPALAGVAAPVLVVGHQHDGVRRRLECLQVPVRVGERHGDPDFASERFQRRPGLGHQNRILRQRRRRDVFQVEHVAAVAAALGQVDEVGHQGGARGGIGQQVAGQRTVEQAVVGVGDRRQHRRRVLGAGDDRLGLRVRRHRDRTQRAVQKDPLRRDHVELVDVLGQRGTRALVPRDIEAHRQRPRRAAGRTGVRAAGHVGPAGLPLQPVRGLNVQRLQHPRVLQRQLRQHRREGQGGEEAGDDQRRQRNQQPDAKARAPIPASGRIMKDVVGHSGPALSCNCEAA